MKKDIYRVEIGYMQNKSQSLIETLTNVSIGYIISFIANMAVLPMFGYDINLTDGFWISIIFTVISVIRGYVVRRWFNMRIK